MDPLCASLLPNNTTHWLAQCNVSLCSTCGALWECCELCDLHFCPYVHVCHSLCCVMICVARHDTLTYAHNYTFILECMHTTSSKTVLCPPTPSTNTHYYNSKHHTVGCCTHTHAAQQYTTPHSVHLYKLLAVSCIDHVPPNPQDGRTPLMLAAGAGHLPVARLLVETYHCDVNEEEDEVSGWEVMGRVSKYSTCVSSHMWPSDTGSWNTRYVCIRVKWSHTVFMLW